MHPSKKAIDASELHITPDFARALLQHRVIAAIEKASDSGQVQTLELYAASLTETEH
jgi:hypothetical protein